MDEKMKNEEVLEDFYDEEDEFLEEEPKKSEGFLSKAKTVLKSHGKRIVAGAAVATVGLIGYALGSRSKYEGEDFDMDSESVDLYELEDRSSSDEATE